MRLTGKSYSTRIISIYGFSDFSKAMMNLISDQTEEDVENDFRKFRP